MGAECPAPGKTGFWSRPDQREEVGDRAEGWGWGWVGLAGPKGTVPARGAAWGALGRVSAVRPRGESGEARTARGLSGPTSRRRLLRVSRRGRGSALRGLGRRCPARGPEFQARQPRRSSPAAPLPSPGGGAPPAAVA